MKINLIIDTENESISILYNGYNIIRTTLYNYDIVKNIYEMLRNEINMGENGIKTEQDFKEFLELKD